MSSCAFLIFAAISFLSPSLSHSKDYRTGKDSASVWFVELKEATSANSGLWNIDIYGPVMLVDPDSRKIICNERDTAGMLTNDGSVFTGTLPSNVNIANTSVELWGKIWAMVMMPLPKNRHDRLNLLAHELFHSAQKRLGFSPHNPDNSHLDREEGRIYLRLELEALKKAATANSTQESDKHISNALLFGMYRSEIFPGADSSENLLDLNEGLAEFTGAMHSGRDHQQMASHFTESINRFVKEQTFVRSFSYQTIPVYGYLLSVRKDGWNLKINSDTYLRRFFLNEFGFGIPEDPARHVEKAMEEYNGRIIVDEESAREIEITEKIAGYRKILADDPHLQLPLVNMNMSFDYRMIMPIDELGTVYPVIRVTDNWGILTVEKGALISKDWSTVSVSLPHTVSGSSAEGEGWTLELSDGYALVHNEGTGMYSLEKK